MTNNGFDAKSMSSSAAVTSSYSFVSYHSKLWGEGCVWGWGVGVGGCQNSESYPHPVDPKCICSVFFIGPHTTSCGVRWTEFPDNWPIKVYRHVTWEASWRKYWLAKTLSNDMPHRPSKKHQECKCQDHPRTCAVAKCEENRKYLFLNNKKIN